MSTQGVKYRSRMQTLGDIVCPHCGSRNPKSAYCCLNCFKIVNASHKSIWRQDVKPGVSAIVIIAALVSAGMFYAKKKQEIAEAEMNIQVQSAIYARSLTDINVGRRIESRRSTALENAENIANQ